MLDVNSATVDWLHSRPKWQQEAAVRVLTSGTLSDHDIDELVALLKTEAGRQRTKTHSLPGLAHAHAIDGALRLVSIRGVEGIENLAPRAPLVFGPGNLTVIYGANGSGKSGYTRILKRLCGKPSSADLRANVFATPPVRRGCVVTYRKGDAVDIEVDWHADGPAVDALRAVDVFDSESGRAYITRESDPSYTPPAVALLEALAKVCERVRQRLLDEAKKLPSRLPVLPPQFVGTDVGKTYTRLAQAQATPRDVDALVAWSQEKNEALAQLEERLRSTDPSDMARQKRGQATQLKRLVTAIKNALDRVSPEACGRVLELRSRAAQTREAAAEAARVITSDSASVPGVGTNTWREMWAAARKYSTSDAYPASQYPHVRPGARCVLCQQPLEPDARARLQRFEEYVVGELETAAHEAEKAVAEALELLPKAPTNEELETACQAAGMPVDRWVPQMAKVWRDVSAVAQILRAQGCLDGIAMQLESAAPWIDELLAAASKLEERAGEHDLDAREFDRASATKKQLELRANAWTAQQSTGIHAELERQSKIAEIEGWLKVSMPAVFSKKASDIAEALITEAYVDRFNAELALMGASHLRVELVKTRAVHGRVMHRIRLKGARQGSADVENVLSEGERRVVELAAFLADVAGKPGRAPFIFDDPISSLDQDFEEKTVERLIALSEGRQVLVFTHRLSLLGLLSRASPRQLQIRHQPWGAGEPGDLSLFAKKPGCALKDLKNSRIPQAHRVFVSHGAEEYYPLAKSICSDVRIQIERTVEVVLLAGVVERHRREVHTKKLHQLAKITQEDCEFIDKMMTRFSVHEHSQSAEMPAVLPDPDELRRVLDEIIEWHDEFLDRAVPKAA